MPLVLHTLLYSFRKKNVINCKTMSVDEKELQKRITFSVKSLICFDPYLVR